MGSRGERARKDLVRTLSKWPGMRERPEGDDAFGRLCAHPTLRLNGARFMSFHVQDRLVWTALHLPPSMSDVEEARPAVAGGADEGRTEAWVDLNEKEGFPRALQLARQLYEVRTGKLPPPDHQ